MSAIDKLEFVGQFSATISPTPFSPFPYQSRFDRVIEYVLNCLEKLPFADNMVKALVLPELSRARQDSITFSGTAPL
jgi:hypothetical protein